MLKETSEGHASMGGRLSSKMALRRRSKWRPMKPRHRSEADLAGNGCKVRATMLSWRGFHLC